MDQDMTYSASTASLSSSKSSSYSRSAACLGEGVSLMVPPHCCSSLTYKMKMKRYDESKDNGTHAPPPLLEVPAAPLRSVGVLSLVPRYRGLRLDI